MSESSDTDAYLILCGSGIRRVSPIQRKQFCRTRTSRFDTIHLVLACSIAFNQARMEEANRFSWTDSRSWSLRESDPDAVELLSKVPQSWYVRHVNGELYRADGRLICLDIDGRVIGVRFNDRCHAPVDLPNHLVDPFHAALRKLSAAYNDSAFWLRLLLGPGDLLVYDNERLLHGRNSFQGDRFLRLCAVERDEFHSRLRVLGRRFGKHDTDLILASGVGV